MTQHENDLTVHMPDIVRAICEARSDPKGFEVSVYGCPAHEERVRHYLHAGLDRVVFFVPPAARDQTLSILDRCAKIKKSVATEG